MAVNVDADVGEAATLLSSSRSPAKRTLNDRWSGASLVTRNNITDVSGDVANKMRCRQDVDQSQMPQFLIQFVIQQSVKETTQYTAYSVEWIHILISL